MLHQHEKWSKVPTSNLKATLVKNAQPRFAGNYIFKGLFDLPRLNKPRKFFIALDHRLMSKSFEQNT